MKDTQAHVKDNHGTGLQWATDVSYLSYLCTKLF